MRGIHSFSETSQVVFLRGEVLQAGRNLIMQQEGTIHQLTIPKTTTDMTGTIQFSIGKSKSTANLLVRGNISWLGLHHEDEELINVQSSFTGVFEIFCVCLEGLLHFQFKVVGH